MDDIGPPPASCSHCGHDDPTEFLPMGGSYFCGACGKKLTTTTSFDSKRVVSPTATPAITAAQVLAPATPPIIKTEQPSAMAEERKDGLVTPIKKVETEESKAGGGGLLSRFTSARKRGEENKENNAPPQSPSPAPSPLTVNPSQPAVPSLSSSSPNSSLQTPIKASVASSPQPTSTPSPTASSQPSPSSFPLSPNPSSSSTAASTSSLPTSTPARTSAPIFRATAAPSSSSPLPTATRDSRSSSSSTSSSADAAALTASIRRELQLQFEREQEILNMERDELEQRVSVLEGEREALQGMLETALADYQQLVDEQAVKRNDYMANLGILEAEMTTLRDRSDHDHSLLHHTTTQLDDTNRALAEHAALVDDLRAQLSAASAELDELKVRYGGLKDTATAKLKASAGEYMAIRQREQEKDIVLHEIRRELQSAMEKNGVVGGRCKEAEERAERMSGEVAALEEELRDTRAELVGMSRELGEVKRVADEWRGKAEEHAAIAQRYKEQVLEQRERMRREEKERREAGRGGGGGGGGGGEEERWRAEALSLRGELERKEAENRELMEMVESLIAQVEQQKQAQQEESY